MSAGLAVVGATATGKTELGIELARRLDGEIIGVDSRQAYAGMSMGTAAPDPAQLASVPHHGIGFLPPTERYSAGAFARRARAWLTEIAARGRVPILVGGTGLFLRALVRPVFAEPALEPERRDRLRRWCARLPIDEVRRWSTRLDPGLSGRLSVIDRQRAARAIEVALLTGRPLGWWHETAEPSVEPVALMIFGLALPPEVHRRRVRERVDRQLAGGWQEEVARLLASGVPADAPAWSAVGYREVAALLEGRLGREEAAAEIARRSWAYARRQRTWFRHQLPGLVWLDATRPIEHLADRVQKEWRGR